MAERPVQEVVVNNSFRPAVALFFILATVLFVGGCAALGFTLSERKYHKWAWTGAAGIGAGIIVFLISTLCFFSRRPVGQYVLEGQRETRAHKRRCPVHHKGDETLQIHSEKHLSVEVLRDSEEPCSQDEVKEPEAPPPAEEEKHQKKRPALEETPFPKHQKKRKEETVVQSQPTPQPPQVIFIQAASPQTPAQPHAPQLASPQIVFVTTQDPRHSNSSPPPHQPPTPINHHPKQDHHRATSPGTSATLIVRSSSFTNVAHHPKSPRVASPDPNRSPPTVHSPVLCSMPSSPPERKASMTSVREQSLDDADRKRKELEKVKVLLLSSLESL